MDDIDTNPYPEIIEGDLFDTPYYFIMHQVNCQGKMGSGVAKQVRERSPECFKTYAQILKNKGAKYCFGKAINYCDVNCGKLFMNVFGQYTYGYDSKQYTDYKALKSGIIYAVNSYSIIVKNFRTLDIAIPYRMGCDLGGGDWNVVYEMLRKLQPILNVRFHCYKLK